MPTITNSDFVYLVRAKKRRAAIRAGCGSFFESAFIEAIGALFGGLWLILGVGIIHHDWIPALPTLGYWRAVLLVWLLRGVFSRIPPAKKSESAR